MKYHINLADSQITFFDRRFYVKKDGSFVPSVTTILDAYPKSKGLLEWIAREGLNAEKKKKDAGNDGAIVHDLTEDYDNYKDVDLLDANNQPMYTPQQWDLFETYVDFRIQHPHLRVIANEQRIIDDRWGGTIDRIFRNSRDNKNWMIDIKTSNSIHTNYWLQLAAYAHTYEKQTSNDIAFIGILHLKGKGKKLKLVDWKEKGQALFAIFEKVYDLWKLENPRPAPKNLTYRLNHKLPQ